jgi:membrane-associated phospholipid phosphatase
MMLKRHPLVFEMIFTIAVMAYLHYIFFMLFPADGPIDYRSQLFGKGSVFIPLMDFIYQTSGQQGGGAFPSTHVSTVVVVMLFTARFRRKSLWLTLPVTVGIIIATVYCSYHYAIDALAGIVSGSLCYFLGRYIYSHWNHPSELPVE